APGRGGGAVVGAVAGGLIDKKHPGQGVVVGASAGALVGGLAGWAVGAYRVKQLRPREEVVAATNYTPQQGVVTKIDRVVASPPRLRPGDQLTFQSQSPWPAPNQGGQIAVRGAGTVYLTDQPLAELPSRDLMLTQGTNEVQNSITLPADAADGNYRVLTTVEPIATPNARRGQATAGFVVSAASPPRATVGLSGPPISLVPTPAT